MQKFLSGVAIAALGAGAVHAGGVERSTQSVGILFEQGTYAEVSVGHVAPDVSGVQATDFLVFPPGGESGDMTGDYTTWTLGFKTDLSDRLSMALVLDEPIGADVNYGADTGYAYGGSSLVFGGSTATLDSSGITAMLRYKLPSNFSVYGGVRYMRTEGEVSLFNGYRMSVDAAEDFGYLVGVAWEKPEIAARIALTYNSAITHDFDAQEQRAIGPVQDTSFSTEIPQSLNLEFQTGIAKDTLVFGSIRWVEWTAFDITPEVYEDAFADSLVDYANDTITYTLGLGRKFSDNWSGAVTFGYEKENDDYSGNLGPTDGYTSVGLAATYTTGNVKITGGARYIWIGDAETESPLLPGETFGEFRDNTGVAFGMRVGYTF